MQRFHDAGGAMLLLRCCERVLADGMVTVRAAEAAAPASSGDGVQRDKGTLPASHRGIVRVRSSLPPHLHLPPLCPLLSNARLRALLRPAAVLCPARTL